MLNKKLLFLLLIPFLLIPVYLAVTYETPDEKAEIQRLEDKVEFLEAKLEKSNIKFEELRKVADEVTLRYNETSNQEEEIQLLKDKVKFLENTMLK